MNSKISFFMTMIPPTVTAQMQRVTCRNGKPIFYKDEKLLDAEDKLKAHLAQHRPERPIDGAIRLETVWCFPLRKGDAEGQPHIERPDTDNLQKLLKDCMTDLGFWKDDAQVFIETIVKIRQSLTGIYIEVEQVEGGQ